MNAQMYALIKKDFRSVTASRRMTANLFLVPLILTVVLPSIFLLALLIAPEELSEMEKLLSLLPAARQSQDIRKTFLRLLLDYLLPVFFLIIPIMTSTIMAASSFVGEKEKHTLETLLYCPLSLKQIFRSKVAASFLLSMIVSFLSFALMVLVLETEIFLALGFVLLPSASWLLILFLVAPAISLIAITLIVRVSAKAESSEEAQQRAVFLLLPILLLLAGQFTGLLLLNGWLLLLLGILCALAAWILLKKCMGNFQYERLLL